MKISFSDLPEDIVTDIFLRFQIKTLLRFRAVSKSWLSIISNPQFIQSHYRIATQKKPSILVSKIPNATPEYFNYISVPKIFCSYGCHFISSCNGIACIVDVSCDHIYLWNPSIKHYTRLPLHQEYPDFCRGRPIGFGYDSISDDYKVICLEKRGGFVKQLQIFSTNDGFWSHIRVRIPLPHGRYNHGGPVINGLLYFEVTDWGDKEKRLISFDLHNHKLQVVTLPSCMLGKRSNILDFEGSLGIMIIDSIGDGSIHQAISLWTLGNGGESYWIEKFRVEVDELSWIKEPKSVAGLQVDFYLGDGKFYGRNYVASNSGGFPAVSHIWFDYEKKEANCFDVGNLQFPQILKYTESLVSVEGFKSTCSLSILFNICY